MLGIVVKHEDPDKYEKRNTNIQKKANNEREKAMLQDRILTLIANVKGDILEDDELIKTLNESQEKKKIIEIENMEMEKTMKSIEALRDQLRPVSIRVARLFFVIADLFNIDPMYQYSLNFFTMIYERALKSADGRIDKNEKNARK
jgi:dynein heavy chain